MKKEIYKSRWLLLFFIVILITLFVQKSESGSITATTNSTTSTSLASDKNMTMSSSTNFNITYNKTSYILKPYTIINGVTTNLENTPALSLSQLTYQPIIISVGDDYKFAFNFTLQSKMSEVGWEYSNLQHNKYALWNKEKTILINFGDLKQLGYNVTIDDKYVHITNLQAGKNILDPYVSFINNSNVFTLIYGTTNCASTTIQANGLNSAIFSFVNWVPDLNNMGTMVIDNITWGTTNLNWITQLSGGIPINDAYYSVLGTQTSNTQTLQICFGSDTIGDIVYGRLGAITINGVNQTNPYVQYKTNTSTSTKPSLNISGTNDTNMIIDTLGVYSTSTINLVITRDSQQNPIYNGSTFGNALNGYSTSAGSWNNASNETSKTNYTLSASKNWKIIAIEVNGKISGELINPLYSGVVKNSTFIRNNQPVNFTTNLTDETALGGYIFSINLGSGFINSSYISLSGTSANVSNVTNILTPNNQITNVTWFFYFNDTSGNVNRTNIQSFLVDRVSPNLTFLYPQNITYESNDITLLVPINITSDGTQDTIIFYNGTSNMTYTSPFYILLDYNVHYIFFAYVNDSSDNFNQTNVSFFIHWNLVSSGQGSAGNFTYNNTNNTNISIITFAPQPQNFFQQIVDRFTMPIGFSMNTLLWIIIISLFLFLLIVGTKRRKYKLKKEDVRKSIEK
jgi:hypothetical protein